MALTMYNFSHLDHSLLPSLTLYPHSQASLFIFLIHLIEWIHQMQFDASLPKVHTFRRSYIIPFYVVEAGIHHIRLQNCSGKFLSLWKIACPNIQSIQACYYLRTGLAMPDLRCLLKNFPSRSPCPLQGKKWNYGFLNKWISFKWHLAFLSVLLQILWRHTKMKIHNISES